MSTVWLPPERRHAVMTALEAVPEVLAELDVTLSRCDAVTSSRSSGYVRASNAERALAFHTGAAKAHAEIAAAVACYSARVSAELGRDAPTAPADQAAFLCTYLPEVPNDSEVLADIDATLTKAVRLAYHMIDRPESRVCVGRCRCGHWLYARAEDDIIRCDGCETIVPVAQRRRQLLSQAYEMMGTAAELARLVPDCGGGSVSADRIRQWARRGRLTGHAVGSRTVYRLGDVVDLCSADRIGMSRSA
ncbi:hypothetical protein ACFV4K_13740 [Nocardia sp. NPDC059764]|uniref:hypothetical protein n=1 Tax=Nocardia sp. NPDC059764 TaxID=3346939 RepID=UPI0036678E4A